MTIGRSHPECGTRLLVWPEMLLPGDLRCRRCDRDLDPSDKVCDASVASGQPHHMNCPPDDRERRPHIDPDREIR